MVLLYMVKAVYLHLIFFLFRKIICNKKVECVQFLTPNDSLRYWAFLTNCESCRRTILVCFKHVLSLRCLAQARWRPCFSIFLCPGWRVVHHWHSGYLSSLRCYWCMSFFGILLLTFFIFFPIMARFSVPFLLNACHRNFIFVGSHLHNFGKFQNVKLIW